MPPMPPSILLHYARDEGQKESDANKPKEDSKPPEDTSKDAAKPKDNNGQKEPPPNAALIAGLVTTTIFIAFIVFVVILPWLKRKREAKKKKPKATLPAISRFMNSKNSRFDRSFHGHRRTPSQLNLGSNSNGMDQAYLPDNRRPPNDQPVQVQRDRDIPAVHFRDEPEHIPPPMGQADSRPVSYQYYIPPPNAHVEAKFPPTPGTARTPVTGRSRNGGDPFTGTIASSEAPYHEIGLHTSSPNVPEGHWDQYQGQQSSRTPHHPDTSSGLTPSSAPGHPSDAGSASPLTAYINHLNSMNPPATAPAYSTFSAPRSAGLPFQHQQSGHRQDAFHQSAHLRSYPEEPEHGLSSGSDYSESPESSSARPGHSHGYGPGSHPGYDNTVPHSMPTHGHVSFAHEQKLARVAASSKQGAGTALRERFGGLSPRPSPGPGPMSAGLAPMSAAIPRSGGGGLAPMSAALAGPRSAGLGPVPMSAGFGPRSAGVLPSPGLLSANPKNPTSHFSPMTPDFRQSRMPLPYDAIPEPPNSSVAYGFALPPSPLSPGDEIVVSPSPYHANFAMNR